MGYPTPCKRRHHTNFRRQERILRACRAYRLGVQPLDSHKTITTSTTPISVTSNLRAIFSSCLRAGSAVLRAAMWGNFFSPPRRCPMRKSSSRVFRRGRGRVII